MRTQSSISPLLLYSMLGVTLILSLTSLLLNVFRPTNEVAFVETARLISSYQGMIDARTDLEGKAKTWRAQLDTLEAEVNALAEAQSKATGMSAKEKVLSDQLVHAKKIQFENYQRTLLEQAKAEEKKVIEETLGKINIFLEGYGKQHGHKVILAATDYGNVAYADKAINVTDEVLKEMNANYTK